MFICDVPRHLHAAPRDHCVSTCACATTLFADRFGIALFRYISLRWLRKEIAIDPLITRNGCNIRYQMLAK